MSTPPPRPPPPPSPRDSLDIQDPQSRPYSAEFGSSMESKQQGSRERERSNTYSAPGCLPAKTTDPCTPPPTPTHPTPSLRHMSSSPPPPLPMVTEGEGEGGNRRGRTGSVGNANGRHRPMRPPPPALRAQSLPRGLHSIPGGGLKAWEQVNGNIGRQHSKSSDNLHSSLQAGSNSKGHASVSGLDSVRNGDHTPSSSADRTPEHSTGDKTDDVTGNDTMGQEQGTGDPSPTRATPISEATPIPDQPVIPPRPYRPPRPFPPPSGSSSHSAGTKHKNKTYHGDPRPKVTPEVTHSTRSQSMGGEKRPDVIGQKSHDTTPSDDVIPHHDVSSSTSHDKTSSPSLLSKPDETGGVRENQSRTLYDADTSTVSSTKSPRSGVKGHRLFSSVRKGLLKIRHKNARSSSIPTARPPPRDGGVIGHDGTLNEIEEETTYPDPLPQGIVDPLVVLCVAYLNRDSVLREAGLFRIPGDFTTVKKLRSDYIRGEPIDLMHVLDPHTVAGMLKYHFRERRVSIIPRGKPLETITAAVRGKDVEGVSQVLQSLSLDSLATLRMVAELLSKVVEYSEWNKMTSGTLATSCGPSFFPYLPPSPANSLLKFMIDHCSSLFPE